MKYFLITYSMSFLLMIATASCMSMQTRRGIAEEQVQMHPELGAVDVKLLVLSNRLDALESLSTKMDTILVKLNVMEEAHRDDIGMLLSEIKKMIDDTKDELKKELITNWSPKPGQNKK